MGNNISIFNSKNMAVPQVFNEIIKDKKFYEKSGGGITLSGGEPLFQLRDARELLKLCKENGIHTAIETALNYQWTDLESVLPYTDLVIADFKAATESTHIACTGVSNKGILENIRRLSVCKKTFWIRVPVIPEINITEEEMRRIGIALSDKNAEKIELIPYHRMGVSKYRIWGYTYFLENVIEPSSEYMKRCYDILKSECNNVVLQE